MNTIKTDWVEKKYAASAIITRTRTGNWQAHTNKGQFLATSPYLTELERRVESMGYINFKRV